MKFHLMKQPEDISNTDIDQPELHSLRQTNILPLNNSHLQFSLYESLFQFPHLPKLIIYSYSQNT